LIGWDGIASTHPRRLQPSRPLGSLRQRRGIRNEPRDTRVARSKAIRIDMTDPPPQTIDRRWAVAIVAGIVAATLAAGAAIARGGSRQVFATDADPHSVIVGYRPGTTRADHLAVERATGTRYLGGLPGTTQQLAIVGNRSVPATLAQLRRRSEVQSAVPDFRVHSSDFVPNDPGFGGAAGWEKVQWNFVGPNSVNAPAAWDLAIRAGAPGARGVRIAVIDSGVAFENYGRLRRSPDLARASFTDPWDFLRGNRHPYDLEGHGTHVTSTIAEETDNRRAVTGLAYGARIIPIRVLDANGNGDGATVARAIRYAVRHHAQVINLSVEFDTTVHAADIPDVIGALRYAYNRGVVLVGASGNEGRGNISYPAASRYVIAVGATTVDGCLAEYSNFGPGLALVAPGGGSDAPFADDPYDRAHCNPANPAREIVQETFAHSPRRFRLVGFEGTSFATPHVTAAVALLLATHRLGRRPSPAQVRARLMATARSAGPAGDSRRYGAGLVDIAAALGP
jgi:serine protease